MEGVKEWIRNRANRSRKSLENICYFNPVASAPHASFARKTDSPEKIRWFNRSHLRAKRAISYQSNFGYILLANSSYAVIM
jgi:hypothetical protein